MSHAEPQRRRANRRVWHILTVACVTRNRAFSASLASLRENPGWATAREARRRGLTQSRRDAEQRTESGTESGTYSPRRASLVTLREPYDLPMEWDQSAKGFALLGACACGRHNDKESGDGQGKQGAEKGSQEAEAGQEDR